MKKLLLILITVAGVLSLAKAQPYGNEWIDYTQPYFKIKVPKTGIYRIPYSALSTAFPGLGSTPSGRFTMYHNGIQEAIYVSNSGILGPTDYIEFMGRKNDGSKETALFTDSSYQAHQLYSLFSDTSAYYLTVNSALSNPRIVDFANDLTSLPPKEEFFMHTARLLLTSVYSTGRAYAVSGSSIWNSEFDMGEGWCGPDFTSTVSYSLATPNIYAAGPTQAYYNVVDFAKSNTNHRLQVLLNSSILADTSFPNYALIKLRDSIPVSLLSATTNTFRFNALFLPGPDRHAPCVMEITYPKQYNFENLSTYEFKVAAGPRAYLRIANFNARSTIPVLYDLTNRVRIQGTISGGFLNYAIPSSSSERLMYLRSDNVADYTTVSSLQQVFFTDLRTLPTQGDYLIITHPSLYDDGLGNNWVEEYRRYRDAASSTTGAFYARTVEADQLYDQFGYGINKSPLAIRNFISYALNSWTIKPKYVLLMGKGREYEDMRTGGAALAQCLVPTYGNPGSDLLMAATSTNYVPRVNIGRLSVSTGTEIKNYLEKVEEYEAAQKIVGDPHQNLLEKDWMKQILHLGGGGDDYERNTFRSYLSNYERIIEADEYGAHVGSLYKTSTAPIDVGAIDMIKARIDSGISLMTFFGHSAPGTFDISVDEPENYTNRGKYPVFYSNGCFAGYIFNPTQGISERFVLVPQKGAIAFLSTTGLSLSSSLDVFGSRFYHNISKDNYGQTLGSSIRKSVADIKASTTTTLYDEFIAHEMTLHGDPALRLNNYDRPDYMISPQTVYFNPPVITASVDTFEVNIVTTNLGKAIVDTYKVDLTRYLPDGSSTIYRKSVVAPFYRDTVTFRIPTLIGLRGLGLNQFSIYVDADDDVPSELSETNNYILNDISTVIQSEDILPVYPYEFAIVPQQPITYKASTVNPFAAPRWYVFEIDTTELFNSASKIRMRSYHSGGVVHFTPSLTYRDSVVYYWRVSQDSTSPASGYAWHNSSHIYISSEYPGWNQSHYYQWLYDDFANIYLDNDRVFKYVNDVKSIEVNTGMTDDMGGPIPWERLEWKMNGSNQYRARMMGCGGRNGINIAVIDPVSGLPWASQVNLAANYSLPYGNVHCSSKTSEQYGFTFNTTGTHPLFGIPWSQVIRNFLDSIPDGFYVLIYSQNNPSYTSWDATLRTTISGIGAVQINQLTSGIANGPWAFFTKKNSPGFIPTEQYANGWSNVVYFNTTITGRWYQGSFTSTPIGPASEWGSMHWRYHSQEAVSTDLQDVDVIGITPSGSETLLFSTTTLDTIITFIDPHAYPYLRLRFNTSDSTDRTPSQPDYWRILYRKVPEAALNPALYFSFNRDTMDIGNTLDVKIAVENLTELPMDSMLVKYTMTDATRASAVQLSRQDSLIGFDTLTLHYTLPILSQSFVGINYLVAEINPDNDQPEQYHFNNFGLMKFYVGKDKINPLLDVTFDGRHILDGDIVSSKPLILITLKDENRYLALDDTSLIKVTLKYPDGSLHPMYYDNFVTTFFPADAARLSVENKARVEVKPELPQDGRYEIIVADQDRSGNKSGYREFRQGFEVINRSMITNVLNYPNPFTTSTRFVFTLTGSEIPTFFKIQILSQSGKVVKEIMQDQIGPIHIGRNITEYAWDGRDEYGDPLGNGVYFYRVVTSINEEKIEHLETAADKFFKKGIGKMVLLR